MRAVRSICGIQRAGRGVIADEIHSWMDAKVSARGAVFHVASSAKTLRSDHRSRLPAFSIHSPRHFWRALTVQFRRATDRITDARSKGIAQEAEGEGVREGA